ncbi:MAG TPA: S16 family serine protease [Candidatus Nanoarchaeia archaeon]|nr:S16 family serine protease [Candidatus Nanoarchaeia archaeon]
MSKVANAMLFFVLGFIVAVAIFGYPTAEKVTGQAIQEQDAQNTTCIGPINQTIERSLAIVAVSEDEDEGIIGNLTVRLIPGNSNVLIETNPFLEPDLQYSANIAKEVAIEVTGKSNPDRDFVFTYSIESQVVGGGSAGAATTLAAIAALDNKTIRQDAIITGTINSDGTIGRVGGILEKAKAASDAGYKLFLVPRGQTVVRYYEREVTREQTGLGFVFYNTRYVPKVLNITESVKEWGLELREVSNIKQAADIMLRD